MKVRIGTRGSALALAQTRQVAGWLDARGVATELVVVKTSGDRIQDRPLTEVGGKGLFVKELEEALVDGRIDLAVHSMKDLPAVIDARFVLAAIPERADARDVLVVTERIDMTRAIESAKGRAPVGARGTDGAEPAGDLALLPALAALPHGARIGTGSLRRRALLALLRPDLVVSPMRGNVDTRLRKLREGELDAIVLAAAGLERLGSPVRGIALDPRAFLPAPGQGALALETRESDRSLRDVCAPLDDPVTRSECVAER